MTLTELEASFKQIARLLQTEVAIRKRNDIYRTKLAEWEQARDNLIAIKDELKRHVGEKQELVRELEQTTFLPPPTQYH